MNFLSKLTDILVVTAAILCIIYCSMALSSKNTNAKESDLYFEQMSLIYGEESQ